MKGSVNYPFQPRDSSFQFFNFWRWLAATWYFYEDVCFNVNTIWRNLLSSSGFSDTTLSYLFTRYLLESSRTSQMQFVARFYREIYFLCIENMYLYSKHSIAKKQCFFFRNPLAKVTFLALLHFRTPTPSSIGALVPSIIGAFVLSIIGTLIPSILYITLFPVSKGHFSHKGLGLRMGLWLGEVRKVQQHQNYFWSVLEQNNAQTLELANHVLSYYQYNIQDTVQDPKKKTISLPLNEKKVVTIVGCVFAEFGNPISGEVVIFLN